MALLLHLILGKERDVSLIIVEFQAKNGQWHLPEKDKDCWLINSVFLILSCEMHLILC